MYKRKTCMFTRATTYDIINRTYHGGAILFFYTFILFFTFFFFIFYFLFFSLPLSLSLSLLFIIINEVIYFKETRRILRNTFDWTISSKYDVEKVANWMDGCCCTRDEKRNFFSTWSRNW